MQAIQEAPAPDTELVPPNRIRVETAFSRFPIHHLAKKESLAIDLHYAGEDGEPDRKWEVTYNQKHGQPGPLAYKVDTLIVNRCIDEAGRPIPEVIKLGSLTELCTALGISDSGENRANIKKSLHQNASAYITAKIRYRTKTGIEKWSEINYTRYSLVFRGEVLPDGTVADAVYIIPAAPYRDLLNHVEVRPLDYDYLTSLSPGAQRFYELLSFQIYGALAGDRARAKMLYSDYCAHAPQARYSDFNRVKKQMFKIHAPHRQAGYITKINYEKTVDGEGAPDWAMFYAPGPKAVAEFEAFTRRQVRRIAEVPRITAANAVQTELAKAALAENDGGLALLGEMMRRGIAEPKARELLSRLKPDQEVMDQLEYVDSVVAGDRRGKLDNPPGLYVIYIRDNVIPPATFVTSRQRRLNEEARRATQSEEAKLAERKLEFEAYCAGEISRYIRDVLPAEDYQQLLHKHRRRNRNVLTRMPEAELDEITEASVRAEIRDSGRVTLPTFDQFLMSSGAASSGPLLQDAKFAQAPAIKESVSA